MGLRRMENMLLFCQRTCPIGFVAIPIGRLGGMPVAPEVAIVAVLFALPPHLFEPFTDVLQVAVGSPEKVEFTFLLVFVSTRDLVLV